METQHRHVAVQKQALAFILNAKCVGAVVDDLQPVGVGDALDTLDIAGCTVDMDRKDRRGLLGDRLLDAVGIHVVSTRLDIDKYWLDVVPQQRMRRGHEGIGRSDDFAGDSQGLEGGHKGEGAIGEQRQVLHPEIIAKRPFEILMERTVVCELSALPYLLEVGCEFCKLRQERLRYENLIAHCSTYIRCSSTSEN